MQILTVTTFFPNSADRHRAVFVENLVRAMRKTCSLRVVSPVPYAPAIRRVPRWYAQSQIARRETIEGIEILHPRFFVLPGISGLSGFGYCLGVLPLLRRLKRDHGACLIHAHCAYPDGVGVALAARLLRLPYVVTAHGSDINVHACAATLRPQIRWALAGADGVIAVSRALEEKIRHLLRGPARNLTCIPCAGFDPGMFFPRPREEQRATLGISMDARVVLFVGQLLPVKAVEFLVEAWAILYRRGLAGDSDRLVIVGDGSCRADLERRVAAAGIASSVLFTGAVPQAEVSRWIAAASLLCLPSRNEGMPNVIVEALASGVPVVATRVGGVPELVRETDNGLLVPPADAGALAGALAAALSRAWDRGGIRDSVAHLTWQALAARNCEFLEAAVQPG